MSCTNCGTSTPYVTYNVQYSSAPCTTNVACGAGYYNGKCVYYAGPNLPCTGINTNDSLEVALQKADTVICSIVANYSTYDFNCLNTPTPITTERQFVERISAYVCATQSQLTTFTSTTFPNYQTSVTNSLNAITSPSITCTAAGVVPTDTLSQILTKYCTTFATLNTAINISGVNWAQCFTVTTPPTTITAAFSLVIDQICQTKALTSGALPTFNNIGTCLPTPGATDTLVSTVGKITTRLCQSPTFDINTISWGCITKPSTTTTDLQAAFQTVITELDDRKKKIVTYSSDFVVTQTNPSDPCQGITLALTTPINQDRLVAATTGDTSPGTLQAKLLAGTNITLDYTTTPGKVIIATTGLSSVIRGDSASISILGAGTSASPLTASVKISAATGNGIIINTDGIFAPSATAPSFNFVESSTILPSQTGSDVSMKVKIDSSQPGNILTFSTNGLYVPAPQSTATTVIGASTSTLQITSTPGSGNSYTLTGVPIISPIATGQILKAIASGLAVQVSQTVGNAITINADGIFVPASASQVNSDWNATSGVSQILNKPNVWLVGGNSIGATPGFFGTNDNQTLFFRQNGLNYIKLETAGSFSSITDSWQLTQAGKLTATSLEINQTSTFNGEVLIQNQNGAAGQSRQLEIKTASLVDSPILKFTGGSALIKRGAIGQTIFIGEVADTGVVTFRSSGLVSFTGSITANTIIKTGGLSTQFLKADGSVSTLANVASSGAYADLSGTPIFINGLTNTAGNIKLGGTLTETTTVESATFSTSFNKSTASINANAFPIAGNGTFTGSGIETNQYVISGLAGSLTLSPSATTTPSAQSAWAAVASTIFRTGSGTFSGITSGVHANVNMTGSSITDGIAGFRAYRPMQYNAQPAFTGTITNYYGLYIDNIGTSDIAANITNKFAIYQVGTADISRFFGPVQNASSVTQFTSDIRVKENITSFTRGLAEIEQIDAKKFNFTYSKDKTVTGIIAQELEKIIPEAVTREQFSLPDGSISYSDFRMVDQNVLFYTMLNAIKTLSAKVKALEN